MNDEEKIFLDNSYSETLNYYNDSINNKKKYGWDWIIITASNKNQANSYKTQIDYRKNLGLIPDVRIDVIPDKNDERIGSGGATLNVLKFLYENDKNWNNKKILLIHSGGDSKRIPQYSACGKLFSYVPRSLINETPSTLFDEFLVTLSLIPDRLKSGILVVSGDVLLLFNNLQIDVGTENSIAISMKEFAQVGQNHGVFLSDKHGKLCKFLHKNNIESLKQQKAIDKYGMVDIDTGLIWIDNNISKDLLSLIMTDGKIDSKKEKKYINNINRLSFYGDLLYPLANNGTIDEYLSTAAEGVLDNNLKECRKEIWNVLNKRSMKVIKTSPSKFIHVGTTLELLNLNTHATENYSFLRWKNNILTNKEYNYCSIINSLIKENVKLGNNSFIENSIIENANIGNNCIITGAKFKGNIDDNTVLQVLPLVINNKKHFVSRVYGINDNPKEESKYLNTTIDKIIEKYNIDKKAIWKSNKKYLWTANLFELCDTEEQAIEAYNRLISIVKGIATENDIKVFKKAKRLNLEDSYYYADMNTITKRQNEIDVLVRTEKIIEDFKNGIDIEECCKSITEKNVKQILKELEKHRSNNDYKLDILISYILENYNKLFPLENIKYENDAYDKLKKIITINDNKKYKINKPKKSTSISLPLRVNFGGGWSDTPPYCIEQGGIVLNAAISLNNDLPVKVKIKQNREGHYKFFSKDLYESVEYTNIDDIKTLSSVGDPFILSKACLICLNIIDSEYLKKFGIEIETNVNVPAGSGLGTSSILAGAIIKALIDFYNIEISENDIYDTVVKVEQLISTGGGWQDQMGGLIPGIKIIETDKGIKQEYKITKILKNENIKELEDKMILIYTGQRRIAKNLLRQMMNKYMLNDRKTCENLKKIQHLALIMKFELEKGTISNFAKLLTQHFELIKEIDPLVTNVCIDHIISTCNDYIEGYSIVGAGGGGFIFAILNDKSKKKELEEKLSEVYKENGVKIYECKFVDSF